MSIEQKLDELNLTDFSKKTIASPTTTKYSIERRGIMGDSPKTTKLIQSRIDEQKDWITFYFLTESTDKYGPDHQYVDVVPELAFEFERDPSKTYEIQLRFFHLSTLLKAEPPKAIKPPDVAPAEMPIVKLQAPPEPQTVAQVPQEPPEGPKPQPVAPEARPKAPEKPNKANAKATKITPNQAQPEEEPEEEPEPEQPTNDEEIIRYFHNQKESQFGIGLDPDTAARDYWDEHLEINPLRKKKETSAGAFLAWMIEAAGDIIREMGKTYQDPNYIGEKVDRLKNYATHERDWRLPLSEGEEADRQMMSKQIDAIPVATDVTATVKKLLQAIIGRRPDIVEFRVGKVESMLLEPIEESVDMYPDEGAEENNVTTSKVSPGQASGGGGDPVWESKYTGPLPNVEKRRMWTWKTPEGEYPRPQVYQGGDLRPYDEEPQVLVDPETGRQWLCGISYYHDGGICQIHPKEPVGEGYGAMDEARPKKPFTLAQVKNWLWSTDFAVWSNAPSFHWQGFNYNMSVLGASIFPTNIEPHVWNNIHGDALIDKHLFDLFLHIKFFINQMASSLINKIRQTPRKEAREDNEMLQEDTLHEQEFLVMHDGAGNVEITFRGKDRTWPVVEFNPKEIDERPAAELADYIGYRTNWKPELKNKMKPAFQKAALVAKDLRTNKKFRGMRITISIGPDGKITGRKQESKIMQEKIGTPSEIEWSEGDWGTAFTWEIDGNVFQGRFVPNSTRLQNTIMEYDPKEDFTFEWSHPLDWKQRKYIHDSLDGVEAVDFVFSNESAGSSVKLTGQGHVGEISSTVINAAQQYIQNNIKNFDILTFEASHDSRSRAVLYIRLVKEVLQTGIYDFKLVTMTNKKSLLTRFFLMKSPLYDNLFRSSMQEAVQEQMRDALVMSYGLFSPPTEEHIKLLKKVVASAGQVNGSNIVFIAQDKQFSHDEMSLRQKAEVLKAAVPQLNICYDEGLFDIYDAFVWAYTRHYKDIYVIAGSDEVSDINQILESSNGQETEDGYFEFNKYKVISYGGGNPDRSQQSAEARNAIINGDFDAFLKSVQGPEFPKFSHAKKLFQIMQYEYKNSVGMSGI